MGTALDTLIFIGLHALVFFSGVIIFFGLGAMLCWRDLASCHLSDGLRFSLVSTIGLGMFICLIQILTISGFLNVFSLSVLAVLGTGLAIMAFRRWSFSNKKRFSFSSSEIVAFIILGAVLLRTVLMPFRPATAWDEVMYHLPHALQWAENGYLSVNEWLRFPWFPYNYDLLYASALLIWDDVLAHLLHAGAGWLCGLMIYHAVRQFETRIHALVATVIWLYLSNDYYDTAMTELGLALFVFAACVTFRLWVVSPEQNTRWLYFAAFLLGVAAGSKYLPLIYLPLFVVGLLMYERRVSRILLTALFFLLPCIYWYARNAIMTGDPFNPFGGPFFGFFDWNANDITGQFNYTNAHSDWPPWLLWPALIPLFMRSAWAETNWRLVIIFSTWSVMTWYLSTGGYVRFLVPAYPVLAVMSAYGWVWMASAWRRASRKAAPGIWSKPRSAAGRRWPLVVVLIIAGVLAADKLQRDWSEIKVSPVQRTAYLQERITGFNVVQHLFEIPRAGIYQFGLEGAILYMPQPVWGDHFGPSRYSDMAILSANDLASKLKSMGIDILVINHIDWSDIQNKAGFDKYFEEIFSDQGVSSYRLKTDNFRSPAIEPE